MWFEIMDLVILRFQYSCVFFYLSSSQTQKIWEKNLKQKKKIIILICNEKKEVILFFSVSSLELWYVSIYFFLSNFFSSIFFLQFFFRYVNVRFS